FLGNMRSPDRLRVVNDQLRPERLRCGPLERQASSTDWLEVPDQLDTCREASAAGHGGLALRGLHEVKEFLGQGANPTPRLLTKASNCDGAAMSVSWPAALRPSASATYG